MKRICKNLDKILIKFQPDATVCRYIFTAKSLSGVTAPIIRSTKTVTTASGTGHNIGTATSLRRGLIGPHWREVAAPYDLYRRLRLQFLVLLMMGAVTPETCRVTLQ